VTDPLWYAIQHIRERLRDRSVERNGKRHNGMEQMKRSVAGDSRVAATISGAVATGVALGVGELIAGLLMGAPSLVNAVGAVVIALQPPGAKDLMVLLFGEADKFALEAIIVVVALALGSGLAIASRSRAWLATAGFAFFGVFGLVASLQDPTVSPLLAAATAALAVLAGRASLTALLGAAERRAGTPDPVLSAPAARDTEPANELFPRRRFLLLTVAVTAGAATSGALGRLLGGTIQPPPDSAGVLPSPRVAAATPLVRGTPPNARVAEFDVQGLTPLVVPNEDFYRIDTRLDVPQIDAGTWRLRVRGMVERELEFTYDELLAMPLEERFVTIACVSNEVGGTLVGNAKWTGVRLDEVFRMAGVKPGATQIVGRAFDGWTAGFPTAHGGRDGQEGLIAVGMNGERLPAAHGFPARLIVPGLYGYVSATKWLTEIELTTLEAFDAYWVPLGWAKEAPILTQSRIDVPQPGSRVAAGNVTIAGVAWAPDRGISAVEVSVDGGDWAMAALSAPLSDDTWVQWRTDWKATEGRHEIRVRATDAKGKQQDERRTPPAPDGARGYHTISVTV
jgi:DMSO/TMAO reductase YedYZ molybdopterin-dependent catalytic subunit